MDTLKSLQVFKAIVEKGSFTKASEQLNMSLAMTSKHLQHLENHVQAKLLHRNNRNLSLTEVGQQYYAEAIQALELLQDAKSKAQAGRVSCGWWHLYGLPHRILCSCWPTFSSYTQRFS